MKIAFATTQILSGSTVIGRILPLSRELAAAHDIHLLLLHGGSASVNMANNNVQLHFAGYEPFTRSTHGKIRHTGARLVLNMVRTALAETIILMRLRPDIIVLVKTLPANVLGVRIAKLFLRNARIIVDADDFELSANQLSSLVQRAAVHASERMAVRMAHSLVAATPFLADHLQQLTGGKMVASLIPTGLTLKNYFTDSSAAVANATSATTLLYIGSVSIASGHRVDLLPAILAAIHRVQPHARLRIAGSGDDVEMLKHTFADLGLTEYVEWTGRFAMDNLTSVLQDVSVLIDPIDASIAQRAKSSFRVSLAAATGIAVVSSNVGIRPYFLPTALHDRFFAIPADVESYTNVINALLTTPLTAEERSLLRSHAEDYKWDALSRKFALCLS